jgi:hypothetical protein
VEHHFRWIKRSLGSDPKTLAPTLTRSPLCPSPTARGGRQVPRPARRRRWPELTAAADGAHHPASFPLSRVAVRGRGRSRPELHRRRRAGHRCCSVGLFPTFPSYSLCPLAPVPSPQPRKADGQRGGRRCAFAPEEDTFLSAVAEACAPPLPCPSSQMPLRGAHRDRAGRRGHDGGALCQ